MVDLPDEEFEAACREALGIEAAEVPEPKRELGRGVKMFFKATALILVLVLIFFAAPTVARFVWDTAVGMWILFLPSIGLRGIVLQPTSVVRWGIVVCLAVILVLSLVWSLRTSGETDTEDDVRIEGDTPAERALTVPKVFWRWIVRHRRKFLVLLFGLLILAPASIPFREMSLSASYTTCKELLPQVQGQPVRIITYDGWRSCSHQIDDQARFSTDPAKKAELHQTAKAVYDELCRYTNDGAAAVVACEELFVPTGTVSQSRSQDWLNAALLVGVIALLSALAYWLWGLIKQRRTAPAPVPASPPVPVPPRRLTISGRPPRIREIFTRTGLATTCLVGLYLITRFKATQSVRPNRCAHHEHPLQERRVPS